MRISVSSLQRYKRQLKRLERKYRTALEQSVLLSEALKRGEHPGDAIPGYDGIVYKARRNNRAVPGGERKGYRFIYCIRPPDHSYTTFRLCEDRTREYQRRRNCAALKGCGPSTVRRVPSPALPRQVRFRIPTGSIEYLQPNILSQRLDIRLRRSGKCLQRHGAQVFIAA